MLRIDGTSLTIADVVRVARRGPTAGRSDAVELGEDARRQIQAARQYIERNWLNAECGPIYGFNTGVGRLKDWRVPLSRIREFQHLLVNAHSAGTGNPFPEDVVRAAMLLRVNANAKGHSGIRVEVLDRMLAMLNAGIHPLIPSKGSVGASGDLAPLAYMAAAVVGHPDARVTYGGTICPAALALENAGLAPSFELGAKEALALLNGSTVSLAIATLAAHDAQLCISTAEIALALTLEAVRGELAAFDERIHAARPHAGQIATARNIRVLLEGSQRCSPVAQGIPLPDDSPDTIYKPRIQDAYSLRCAPQVHGPVLDALTYVQGILSTEINSATDNPLMFAQDSAGFEVLSGGNFHGQYIAQAMDLLTMAFTDLGSISERRASRLLDPSLSHGLPVNLVANEPGLNTGFSIAQCTMAALVAENKTLCWPASADSIPTKSNQEDHISNSTWCARKAALVLENVIDILSIELLMAAQAIALGDRHLGRLNLGRGTAAAYELLRASVPPMLVSDRWLHGDIESVRSLVRAGRLVTVAHAACRAGVGGLVE